MKKSIFSFLVILFTQNAIGGCLEDFRYLQDKTKVTLKKIRETEVTSKKDLSKLREAELKAVNNYIDYLKFQFDEDYSLFVRTEQYQTKDQYKSSVGYKISVTDGGDESNVRYYIKIDVGMEDVTYPILFRAWDNQSPERHFLCEND